MTKVLALTLLVFPAIASADDSVTPPPPPPPAADTAWCHWHHSWPAFDAGDHPGRVAIGFAKSHVDSRDGGDDATQRSFVARVQAHHGWEIELELAKLDLGAEDARTAGAAIVKSLGHRHLRPYLLAGAGGGRIDRGVDRADGTDPHLHYAELGAGLMLRGRHLAIGFDLRRGVRHVEADGAAMTTAARMTTPTEPADDHYVRGRVLALVYF